MNIENKKSVLGIRSVVLTLTPRETELLTAIIGGTSTFTFTQTINAYNGGGNVNAKVKATSQEVGDFFGYNTYRALEAALKAVTPPKIVKVVEFVYDKKNGSAPTWRTLSVTTENSEYIEGLEEGEDFKRFLKSRIVGGRILSK